MVLICTSYFDFPYSRGTKANDATSCGNAFVTNILSASAGEVKPPRSLRSLRGLDFLAYPAGVADFHYNQ